MQIKQLIPVSAPTVVEFYYLEGHVAVLDLIAWALCEDIGGEVYVDGVVCEDNGVVTVGEFWNQRSKLMSSMGYKICQKLINPRDLMQDREEQK